MKRKRSNSIDRHDSDSSDSENESNNKKVKIDLQNIVDYLASRGSIPILSFFSRDSLHSIKDVGVQKFKNVSQDVHCYEVVFESHLSDGVPTFHLEDLVDQLNLENALIIRDFLRSSKNMGEPPLKEDMHFWKIKPSNYTVIQSDYSITRKSAHLVRLDCLSFILSNLSQEPHKVVQKNVDIVENSRIVEPVVEPVEEKKKKERSIGITFSLKKKKGRSFPEGSIGKTTRDVERRVERTSCAISEFSSWLYKNENIETENGIQIIVQDSSLSYSVEIKKNEEPKKILKVE